MESIIYVFVMIVRLLLSVIQMLMLARAILSWLPFDDDSTLARFLYFSTEPIIIPVRRILERIGMFSGLPIDLSFLFTYIIISFISLALPTIYI